LERRDVTRSRVQRLPLPVTRPFRSGPPGEGVGMAGFTEAGLALSLGRSRGACDLSSSLLRKGPGQGDQSETTISGTKINPAAGKFFLRKLSSLRLQAQALPRQIYN
jgi:hypothetical protein